MMPTVLITGATGLVGSRLLPRLVARGYDCRALMRRDLPLPTGVTPISGDLKDTAALNKAVEGVDAVVHLAALFRTGDDAAIWAANLDGTRNLLNALERGAGGARLVMASTGNVYNQDASQPSRENDPCSPTAAYPASKLAAEELVRHSALTWSILRLPFVYGDGDGHLASIPALAKRFALHPAHTYSVAHHQDVAVVVDLALNGAVDRQIVNVTDDAPVTVLEMAMIASQPIEGSSEPLTHPWGGRMDSSRLRSLGFKPSVPTIWHAAATGIL